MGKWLLTRILKGGWMPSCGWIGGLFIFIAQSLLKFMSIESVMSSISSSVVSSPAFNLSQRWGLLQWVSSSHQVAKVLECQLQHQSFQWRFRTDFLLDGLVGSPCSPRDSSRVFSNTTVQKHQFFGAQLSLWSNSQIYTWLLEKPLTRWIFVSKVMSLLFNMLSRFEKLENIAFLSRTKHLLISWLWSPSAVILEPQKIKLHCFHCFPICLPWNDGTGFHDLSFLNVDF